MSEGKNRNCGVNDLRGWLQIVGRYAGISVCAGWLFACAFAGSVRSVRARCSPSSCVHPIAPAAELLLLLLLGLWTTMAKKARSVCLRRAGRRPCLLAGIEESPAGHSPTFYNRRLNRVFPSRRGDSIPGRDQKNSPVLGLCVMFR